MSKVINTVHSTLTSLIGRQKCIWPTKTSASNNQTPWDIAVNVSRWGT